MEYLVDGVKYELSYQKLRQEYEEFIRMSDQEFMSKLVEAAELACVIGMLKEKTIDDIIGDKGIVHELLHLMRIPEEPTVNLKEIRELFKTQLKLAY